MTSPACSASDLYLNFPIHLVSAMGWLTSFSSFPQQPEQSLQVQVRPSQEQATVAMPDMRHWLKLFWFVAALRDLAQDNVGSSLAIQGGVHVECCLVHAVCWRGLLPAQTTFAELEAIWELSCYATACHPAARIFTGPYPVAPQTTVQACFARDDLPKFRSRDGSALVLTVMPSFSGGGAKDDKIQLAKSRIAKACLEQGFTLPDVNRVGAQLTQQVPLASRLAQKVQSQVRKKNLFQQTLTAEDFSLCGGFFVNEDGTPTNVLTKLVPGACGIILLDKPVAEEVIRNMTHSQQDELAVLTLGHECPHPASCCKALRFPAQASSSEGQVLLAGCIHNLGARKVTATMREGPAVNVTAMVQCSFHSFRPPPHGRM